MSLYEMIFADGKTGLPLLASLGFKTTNEVGRYRSAWLEKGGNGVPRIAVYTRNGGGNRETYQSVMDTLSKHKNYLFDQDDTFDSTYATIYFSIPDELRDTCDAVHPGWEQDISDAIDMSKVWKEKINSLHTLPSDSDKD